MATLSLMAGAFAAEPKETVIYAFQGQSDGDKPRGLVADAAGNLYGTAQGGTPIANAGVVYKLSPPAKPSGSWTFDVLYTFQGGVDGYAPVGSLTFDGVGNLYGVTAGGGSSNCHAGCGTVFELSPPSLPGGSWTKNQLYAFQGGPSDGDLPESGVVFSIQKGNLFGTTYLGGNGTCTNGGCGTVFELTPPSNGSVPWTETVLYSFQGGADGGNPTSPVIPDFVGNLYGETSSGGDADNGTIFELVVPSQPGAAWTKEVYSFDGGDGGGGPAGGLTGHGGMLYGTTLVGGTGFSGTAFQMSLVNGKPKETVLHDFTLNELNYSSPEYGVVFDSAGNLYGAAAAGDCGGCYGVVFMLRLPSKPGGRWDYIGLYGFGDGSDGGNPSSGVIVLNDALYGTTLFGGDFSQCDGGCGVVYSITAQ
jgi:hypothetical protein